MSASSSALHHPVLGQEKHHTLCDSCRWLVRLIKQGDTRTCPRCHNPHTEAKPGVDTDKRS